MNVPEYKLFIDGDWVAGREVVEIRSPFNGEVAGLVHLAQGKHVEMAIEAAERGFRTTRQMPTHRRAAILEALVAGLKEQRETFARLIALEAGKPIKQARVEAGRAILTFTDALEESKRIRGEWLPLDLDSTSEGRFGLVRRFPMGPVTAITPFNFPLNLVSHKVAPAMACGNTMVLKPASQTPLSALHLAKLVAEAGAPPGLLNVIACPSRLAEPLIVDARMKYLTFTGSGAVGWALKPQAGKKRVALELGGNAGVVVHSDADLEFAAQRCVLGSFAYAGQTCISIQRIYVHRPVFDSFSERFLALTRALKVGDPLDETTDVGPMITTGEAIRAATWVKEAIASGARLLCGGECSGAMMQPTVLTGTRSKMKVNCQEVFAPVVTLEPYDEMPEALERLDDSLYGLQAGIFTRDIHSIFQAFEQVEVGGLIVNDVPTWRADAMPYGGIKDSGLGREGVRYAIEEMTERKVMVLNLKKP